MTGNDIKNNNKLLGDVLLTCVMPYFAYSTVAGMFDKISGYLVV